jgi:hypothetical protein
MGNTAMWKFVFADAELSCKNLAITVSDSATKAVEDQMFNIETFGNASAMYPTDFSAAIISMKLADTAHGGSATTFTFERFIGLSTTSNEPCVKLGGNGTAAGFQTTGGINGPGAKYIGGSSSGAAILLATTSGHGIDSSPTAGDALHLVGNGSGNNGIYAKGADAVGSAPAGQGIYGLGGSATTTGGGTAGAGFTTQGGSGAASTNPAGKGTQFLAGTNGGAGGADAFKLTSTGTGIDINGNLGGFTASALAQFFTTNTTKVYTDAIAGSVVKEMADATITTANINAIRNAITGGAYALSTDASGMIRIVDGTGTGELDTSSGAIVQVNQLGTQAKTDVKNQVIAAINTDTYAEPGQTTPSATLSLVAKVGFLYKFARNKITQTSIDLKIYDDAGSVVDQKATVSDDGTTFTRNKIGTGP